jgi:hypothetical protein
VGTTVQVHPKRLAEAQAELAKTEARYMKQIGARGAIDQDVMNKSAAALKVQDLVAEFGRLKEEHRQLDVERQLLARSGGTAVPSVRGCLKRVR